MTGSLKYMNNSVGRRAKLDDNLVLKVRRSKDGVAHINFVELQDLKNSK